MTENYIFRVCPACTNLTSLDIVSVAILCWTFAMLLIIRLILWTQNGTRESNQWLLEAPINKTRETGLNLPQMKRFYLHSLLF